MSATNRGSARRARDYYPTPAWCVYRLLDALGVELPTSYDARWLEPSVGDGAIVRAVRQWNGGCAYNVRWTTCDLVRPPRAVPDFHRGDYLELRTERFDVAIGNPPFALAEPFVAKMRRDADVAIALLRLGFLASAERAPFLRAHRPDVYVLPDRPSFTGNGETDASDYAWFVWGLRGGTYQVLDTTPAAERRPRRAA